MRVQDTHNPEMLRFVQSITMNVFLLEDIWFEPMNRAQRCLLQQKIVFESGHGQGKSTAVSFLDMITAAAVTPMPTAANNG
jgi:hypothetical protein